MRVVRRPEAEGIADALQDCLERLEGGEPLHAVLARHPRHARELADLLMTSQLVRRRRPVPARRFKSHLDSQLTELGPVGEPAWDPSAARSRGFVPIPGKAWYRTRLHHSRRSLRAIVAALNMRGSRRPRRPLPGSFTPVRRASIPVALIAAALLIAGAVTSQPGDALYPVRSAGERVGGALGGAADSVRADDRSESIVLAPGGEAERHEAVSEPAGGSAPSSRSTRPLRRWSGRHAPSETTDAEADRAPPMLSLLADASGRGAIVEFGVLESRGDEVDQMATSRALEAEGVGVLQARQRAGESAGSTDLLGAGFPEFGGGMSRQHGAALSGYAPDGGAQPASPTATTLPTASPSVRRRVLEPVTPTAPPTPVPSPTPAVVVVGPSVPSPAPLGKISGRITLVDGSPFVRLLVSAYRLDEAGLPVWSDWTGTRTDEAGEYSLYVTTGSYAVAAGELGYFAVRRWYVDTLDWREAEPVRVPFAGDVSDIDVHTRASPWYWNPSRGSGSLLELFAKRSF